MSGGGEAVPTVKAATRSPSTFRRLMELMYMLIATIAALIFFQKAKEIDGEKDQLERELRKHKDAAMAREPDNKCSVCLGDVRQVALQPCGHVCLCKECARTISAQQDRKCPVCRQKVTKFENVYLC